ncbi:PepSY-associated TM helix domain-containing protein [Novosphingobium sp. H3SJ31-1]|uniref:PepSY-associated TM helix domain-containing protein n=2 Tax=Novosphingobium album (ex Liu et al. 2023) TaxID=3031130 RepID=A0ABT5WXG5_9SPHN|nr:PepSY-associated TM helix domain-containing protein [Novosphingobium album (ex Liu et al. 2023)]
MRKWHRWLSVLFGIFLLWIATTGVLSHVAELWPAAAPDPVTIVPPPGFECPEGWRCSPPRPEGGMRSLVGLLHHLHSGESFGPVGKVISLLSGLAMVFFAFSGLWLYVQMWRNRKDRLLKPRWFWK